MPTALHFEVSQRRARVLKSVTSCLCFLLDRAGGQHLQSICTIDGSKARGILVLHVQSGQLEYQTIGGREVGSESAWRHKTTLVHSGLS